MYKFFILFFIFIKLGWSWDNLAHKVVPPLPNFLLLVALRRREKYTMMTS